MIFRHPSRRALREWLERDPETHDEGTEIDQHLETCQRCASIMEELDSSAEVPLAATLGNALAEVYRAPADLSDRLERRVVARLDSRVVLDLVSDLFGAGIETSKLLLTEEPPDE